jgi:hypothetical protein
MVNIHFILIKKDINITIIHKLLKISHSTNKFEEKFIKLPPERNFFANNYFSKR